MNCRHTKSLEPKNIHRHEKQRQCKIATNLQHRSAILPNRPVIVASIHLWKMNQTFGDDKVSFASACMQLQKMRQQLYWSHATNHTHVGAALLLTLHAASTFNNLVGDPTSRHLIQNISPCTVLRLFPSPLYWALTTSAKGQWLIHAQLLDPARGGRDCGYQRCSPRILLASESGAASRQYSHWHWS